MMEAFLGCDKPYENADTVIFGAPFDSTTSYRPGTRFASRTMRAESYALETYSPYQDADVEDLAVHDGGDLELCFGDTKIALQAIEDRAAQILEDGKRPVMIGGEHLVTLGAVRATAQKYPELHVIHFDAHTDLREDYLGVDLSHATVIRRVWDILGDGRIYQFGIRSGLKEEFEWGKTHTNLQKFNFNGLEDAVKKLEGKPVYFTIDLDVLDPSVFPGTGTPEPGGVSFMQLLNAIYTVCKPLNIVACDLNELSPVYDQSGIATAAALKILRELLIAVSR
jgi:agmatinase